MAPPRHHPPGHGPHDGPDDGPPHGRPPGAKQGPKHGPKHGHPHRPSRPLPASRALHFVDEAQLDHWLEPLVPDAADRRFIRRCLVGEGPIHHRGANYVLLALLAQAVQRTAALAAAPADGVPVPMRLPPHLAGEAGDSDYPLRLPLGALRQLAGGDEAQLQAMVDCLTDGPPQHALANVVMVALIDRLLAA